MHQIRLKKYQIMALIAVIEFGDNDIKRYSKQYMISDCHIVHQRPYNKFSPEGMARCERLEVSVICPGREDLNLYEWYDTQGVQNGRVVIRTTTIKTTELVSEQIIYFENAQCFHLSESYDIESASRRILKLGIEADSINIDDIVFSRA